MKNGKILFLAGIILLACSLFCSGLVFADDASPLVINYIFEDGLASGKPSRLAVDGSGWLWAACSSEDNKDAGGLSIITRNRRILTYTKDDGLASNNVLDVAIDEKNGAIWVATSEGLSRWDTIGGKWKVFDKSNSSLEENYITVLYLEPDGSLLIGTSGGGLYEMKGGAEGKPERIKCPFAVVSGILRDKKDRLWVSSNQGIAYRENEVWVSYNEGNSSLSSNQVGAIAETVNGKILGASPKGIVVFSGITWSVVDTSNSGLPVDQINDILVDPQGQVWVATGGGGVVKFDETLSSPVIYSRKNCEIMDNRVNSIKIGGNDIWLGTARGISLMRTEPSRNAVEKAEVLTLQGYSWRKKSADKVEKVTLQAGLGGEHYAKLTWGWLAFICDGGFDALEPDVTVSCDPFENGRISVGGEMKQGEVLQACLMEGEISRNYAAYQNRSCPFPSEFEPGIQVYLKSSPLIPSDDVEIKKIAKSLIRNSSKGDMLKTAEDIVFSKLFANMPYDISSGWEDSMKDVLCVDPAVKVCGSPQNVLKERTGKSRSKNRLACALLKSAGIPARLVAGNSGRFWGEAYIIDIGWVPFDVSAPVYSIGEGRKYRVRFPMVVERDDLAVVGISGSGDNLRPIFWLPSQESFLTAGAEEGKRISDPANLSKARFLLVKPVDKEKIPSESRIPVSKSVIMSVRKKGSDYSLKFYNPGNKLFVETPIVKMGSAINTGVEGRVEMTVVPEKMGEYILLRIFKWRLID